MDVGAVYGATRRRVSELVRPLSPSHLATVVPACPHWTVRDLVAHLAGVAADTLEGRLEGRGTEAWTAAQVAARHGRGLEELLAEWAEAAAPLEARLSADGRGGKRLIIDLVTHEHDLRGAIGRPGTYDDEASRLAAASYLAAFAARAAEADLPPLVVVTPEGPLTVGAGSPAARVTVDRVDLVRALAGRRSASQVASWAWSTDPDPWLDVMSVFGPLPEIDVRE